MKLFMFRTVPLSINRSLFTVHSAIVYVIEFVDSFRAGSGCSMWINSWWWTEELSETWRVSCQNKFVRLVHLVGFIVKLKYTYSRSQIRCTSVPIVWYGNYLTCLSLRNETIHLTKGRMVTVWGTPPYETPKIPAVCTSTPYRVTVGLQVRGTDSAPICRTVRGQSKE